MLTESPGITPSLAVERRESSTPGYLILGVLFSLETLAINVARLPESMRFDRFAFCDHGANLTLQFLIANGLRPSLDFGYHYGLLPALVGHLWFGVFGATPFAYQAAMVLADLLCAWALAKILAHIKVGAVGLALVFITLGYAYQSTYVNFAHAIEAVLLSHALAQQICGSRSRALALTTAAVFAKPTMGFVYGVLLITLIVRDLIRAGFNLRSLVSSVMPAAIVFVSLAAVLSAVYGARTFLHTALPIEGATAYHSLRYGLFASGHAFWDPKGLPWIFYFIDVAGFWIVSTIFLLAAALLQLRNLSESKISRERKELILTCVILHLAFLMLFFGNQWSWIYYSYLLVIGASVAVDLGPAYRRFGIALCVLALISWTDLAYWTHRWWQTTTPDVVTAGLWAPEGERGEWLKVLGLTRHRRAMMLDSMGASELMFPGFEKPVSLYLIRGLMTPDDVTRKVTQLSNAEIVVVPITIQACSGVPDAPEFRDPMKQFEMVWSGEHFQVFARRVP